MRKKKSRKRLKGAGLIGLIVIVALVIVSLVYVSNYYHVQDTEIMVRRNGMEKRIFRRGTAERAGESMEILRNRLK